jgi:DNA invertase Pin-like site-specific DNA recombinase
MKTVVAYCRSACEEPGTPSSAYSQADAIQRYAEQRGLTLSTIYTDAGMSGVRMKRPGLERLLADCRAGKVGMIITKDADRLSRDMGQLIALLHIFAKAGVRVENSAREGQRDRYLELSALAELIKATRRSK